MSETIDTLFWISYSIPGMFAAKRSISLYESYILKKYDGSKGTVRQIKMDGGDWSGAITWGVASAVLWPAFFVFNILARPARWFFMPPVQKEVEKQERHLNEVRMDALALGRSIQETKALEAGAGLEPDPHATGMLEDLLKEKVQEVLDLGGENWEMAEDFKSDMRKVVG